MKKIMPSHPRDTNPEIEKIQISLIRKTSIAKRISLLRSISQTAIMLSRRAIMRANPELSEQALKYKIVEHHYGSDLSERFRRYSDSKSQ